MDEFLPEKTILTEKFRFLRDDVFLCPEVDIETGHQQVMMQKIDIETGKVEFEKSYGTNKIM